MLYLLNAVDGCMPSDMATGREDDIEESRVQRGNVGSNSTSSFSSGGVRATLRIIEIEVK